MASDLTGMALGDAYVDIMGNTNKLASDLARAQGMVGGFMKSVLTGAAIASPFILAGGVIMKSFNSWMTEESSIARMGNMFDAVGLKTTTLAPKIEALAQVLMRTTTLTDESVRAMATQAAQMGVSESNIEGFIKAAVGMGARLGRDPESTMRLIIRASQGHMTMLSRMGIQIDATKSKQDQFNQVLAFAAKGMGVAFKETNTLAGGFKQLRDSFGEIFDTLGKGLFERSGLNKEIKKVTASVFAIIASLEKGFSTKAFKGFNFEGLGDWIGKLLIKFTAMLMTLPDAFKVLKDIFSNPDKLILILGEGMISVGRILITTIIEGFATMQSLFVGLGKILVSVFAEGIANLPIIGAKVTAHYGREYLGGMSAEDQFKLVSQKTGFAGTYRPGAMNTLQEKREYNTAVGQFLDSFNEIMPEKMKEMREKMFRSGFNETMNAIPIMIKNVGTVLKEEMVRLNALIKKETNADLLAIYNQRLAELTALADKEKKDLGISGGVGGIDLPNMGSKASFSIISMADQWKKMQEGITKDKDSKDIKTATKDVVKNTSKTNELLNTLITNFGGGDTSVPLFSPGY